MYVPKKPTSQIVALVGEEAAQKLCDEYGPLTLEVPNNSFLKTRKCRVLELAEIGGKSHRQIAREAGCTERYVRMVLSEMGLMGGGIGR